MIEFVKQPGQKILELGGGSNPHSASDVRVDVRPGPHTDFIADFNEPLPISDDEFDAVLCVYCIEHLSWRKVRQFVGECKRVLKPGGKVVMVTADVQAQVEWAAKNPNGWDGKDAFESFSCIVFGDQDYPENSHRCWMDKRVADELFQDAGYINITVRPWGERSTDMLIEASRPKGPVNPGPRYWLGDKPEQPASGIVTLKQQGNPAATLTGMSISPVGVSMDSTSVGQLVNQLPHLRYSRQVGHFHITADTEDELRRDVLAAEAMLKNSP